VFAPGVRGWCYQSEFSSKVYTYLNSVPRLWLTPLLTPIDNIVHSVLVMACFEIQYLEEYDNHKSSHGSGPASLKKSLINYMVKCEWLAPWWSTTMFKAQPTICQLECSSDHVIWGLPKCLQHIQLSCKLRDSTNYTQLDTTRKHKKHVAHAARIQHQRICLIKNNEL